MITKDLFILGQEIKIDSRNNCENYLNNMIFRQNYIFYDIIIGDNDFDIETSEIMFYDNTNVY